LTLLYIRGGVIKIEWVVFAVAEYLSGDEREDAGSFGDR
jgi:hypothetical protein